MKDAFSRFRRLPRVEVLPAESRSASAPRRVRRRRRSRRRAERRRRLAILVAMAAAIPALAVALTWLVQVAAPILLPDPPPPPGPTATGTADIGQTTESLPTVFPYSVVPGGVHSPAQLRAAIANDQVVARHYAGIRADVVVETRLIRHRRVHVSYRVGDRVYWTRRPVLLSPGERLLTDGVNEVRARCGNRIDDRVLGETLEDEPAADVLDTPLASGRTELVASAITTPLSGDAPSFGHKTDSWSAEGAPGAFGWPGGSSGTGSMFGRMTNTDSPTTPGPDVPGGGGPTNRSPREWVDPENPSSPGTPGNPGAPGKPENPRVPGTPPYTPPGVPRNTGETPEPATFALLALGAGAWLAGRARRGNV